MTQLNGASERGALKHHVESTHQDAPSIIDKIHADSNVHETQRPQKACVTDGSGYIVCGPIVGEPRPDEPTVHHESGGKNSWTVPQGPNVEQMSKTRRENDQGGKSSDGGKVELDIPPLPVPKK